MEYFVDFVGFYNQDSTFYLKAIAVLSDSSCCVLCFKPPMDTYNEVILFRSLDYWGREHVIPWDAGEIEYESLATVLHDILQNAAYIYVMGDEKKQWLRCITDSDVIIDLSKMRYANYLEIYEQQQQHRYSCPYENVQLMKKWFSDHYVSSMEKSLQLFYQLQTLTKMTAADIAWLDETFILQFVKSEICLIWSKLPEYLQTDQRFINYLRCEEHWDGPCCDTFDGPLPYKKDCSRCQENK